MAISTKHVDKLNLAVCRSLNIVLYFENQLFPNKKQKFSLKNNLKTKDYNTKLFLAAIKDLNYINKKLSKLVLKATNKK